MKRIVSRIAVVTALVASFAVVGATVAGATATLVVTPSTNLTSNQEVVLTGSGFTPSTQVGAAECLATATTATATTQCNTSAAVVITTNADGTLPSTNFFVETGTVGSGTCGTSATDASSCVIAIGDVTFNLLADAAISFVVAPSVTVTPNANLANGDSVAITGANFTPADSVFAVECLAAATSEAGCDVATATPITVNADGTLPSTTFKVVTGTVGTGTCGTSAADAGSCIIEVANTSGGDRGAASISFKTPTVTKPKPKNPKALKVSGQAVIGKIKTLVVIGTNFKGRPSVTGHAGSLFRVIRVSPTRVTLWVKEGFFAKRGIFTMRLHFPSGKSTSVSYRVR